MVDHTSRYDLVVFGATGFVGRILCGYLLEQVGINGAVKWAIAGRSQAKLDALISELGASSLPQIVADVSDEASLRDLCAKTQVVISTVGPYALYGEPLVKVCAETGTDYCDLTGEPQWIRRMIEQYSATAERSGARIVHCCGFDSIPSDLGVYYLQQRAKERFGEGCDRIKMRVKAAMGGVSGGTAASGINLVQEASGDPALRQELDNPYSLCPDSRESLNHSPTMVPVQYDQDFQGWVSPFVMAAINTRIVLRSNALLDYGYGQQFQYDEAILTGPNATGWLVAQGLSVGLGGVAAAMAFSPTRWLLENTLIPKSGEGPSQVAQKQGFYDLRFWGATSTGQTIQVKVTGDRDPGYGSTAKILGQAGLCLAEDFPPSAKAGGFWTPASMFGEVLIERLVKAAGLTFEVC
ncbi:saccharopine dehydrogenase NADP-binding domain-containing protein [Leptolyngbya cf. ectocarpi LEGE 11479]|uniref:Saccharopine dehydrogenase NADP-binding domain-containing protein n=1 Tax=Leptolyngbya cf. ectocarpi LEGE 11479 TaxID=1828722 RepID=A0A928ZV57_LEPEC|nr:saccharopine dehydrogenase NADP-binding domain-containing protein [Leptolyngbya ectocarpi]MBE9068013.1 saccharopine dehydrogenase NADP-binding domain-containing protein [Leptolyngbya cf. ectocarpi LEGE 11479]